MKTIILMILTVIVIRHIDFVIHIPAMAPLYMETVDSKIVTFSGGVVSDGILSKP